MLWGSAFIGLTGAVTGLLLSFYADIPSGPCIVLVLAVLLSLSYLFSPHHGVLIRVFRKRHLHEESLGRWRGHEGHEHNHPENH
jgi:hypothetical protein